MAKLDKEKYNLVLNELKKNGKVSAEFGLKHGIPHTSLYRHVKKAQIELGIKKIKVRKTRVQKQGLESFIDQFDDSVIIPRTIEEGVAAHLTNSAGEPCWMRDKEFRELCGVPIGRWRRYADEFKELQVTVAGGDTIWGHPDIIDEMRRAVQR
jgi:hypothetical protein